MHAASLHRYIQGAGVAHALQWQSPDACATHAPFPKTAGACARACAQVRAFSFAAGGLAAAQRLHERLLGAVVRAPLAFFDTTPTGRVLNRFSSDQATADDSLPFIMCAHLPLCAPN